MASRSRGHALVCFSWPISSSLVTCGAADTSERVIGRTASLRCAARIPTRYKTNPNTGRIGFTVPREPQRDQEDMHWSVSLGQSRQALLRAGGATEDTERLRTRIDPRPNPRQSCLVQATAFVEDDVCPRAVLSQGGPSRRWRQQSLEARLTLSSVEDDACPKAVHACPKAVQAGVIVGGGAKIGCKWEFPGGPSCTAQWFAGVGISGADATAGGGGSMSVWWFR